jgi:hypothetical protein
LNYLLALIMSLLQPLTGDLPPTGDPHCQAIHATAKASVDCKNAEDNDVPSDLDISNGF